MGFNPFNSNPQLPSRKPLNNNNPLGGRREITDIKKEMLDTTKPELRKSYIAKYHREDNKSSDLPVSNNQDSTLVQKSKIENMRNLRRGL